MTLREEQSIFWQYMSILMLRASSSGTPIFLAEWLRSEKRQRYLISIGQSWTMDSDHVRGTAGDVYFLHDVKDDGIINTPPENYRYLGLLWESLDPYCQWGGRFGLYPSEYKTKIGKDAGHFGYRYGRERV